MKKAVPLVLLLLVVVGCRTRLNQESVVTVEGMDKHWTTIDKIGKAQKVNVSATATTGQVNVYVYLKKNQAAAEKEIDARKPGTNVLAHAEKTTQASLSAQIDANEEAVVLVMSGDFKKAEAKLKITN